MRYGLPLLEIVCNAEKQATLRTAKTFSMGTLFKKNYITKTFIANALECGGFKILVLDQLNLFYFKTSDYSFSLPEISLPSSFGGIDKVMLIPFSKGRL